MGYKVGDIIVGKITSTRPFALFLCFDDGSQGLLHISELSDEYVRDIEKYGVVGDEIKVKILSIDPSNGFLRVSYKQVPNEEKYTSHTNSKRNNLIDDSSDFVELEKKLPEWINSVLEKEGK